MKAPKVTEEIVEITVPFRIRYSTPEGRAYGIKEAQKGVFLGSWNSQHGGVSIHSVRPGTKPGLRK